MKKNFKLLMFVVIAMFAVASCTNAKKSNESSSAEPVDMHTSQISLDWAGTYSGVLPCASCEGIETELIINRDETYSLTTSYLGEEDPLTSTKEGTFSWIDGNTIKLSGFSENEGSSMYKVEENQVRHLDLEGNIIEGELENFYVLAKEGNPVVEDQRWQLVELNGKPVEGDADSYYIIFHSEDSRAEAKADCNVLLFNYKIKNQLRIELHQGISTLMACPEGSIEDEYREVLNTVDNLSTDGETLTLNKARMAPLAKFVLVAE